MTNRLYHVTLKVVREYSATITVRARNQAKAEAEALSLFNNWRYDLDSDVRVDLGFPKPWNEHESYEHDPEIDTKFHCGDCGKCTSSSGEYYMVRDEVWAASGMAPHGGMLCLRDLERRIGRELTEADFTAIWPSGEAWHEHLTARETAPPDHKTAKNTQARRSRIERLYAEWSAERKTAAEDRETTAAV